MIAKQILILLLFLTVSCTSPSPDLDSPTELEEATRTATRIDRAITSPTFLANSTPSPTTSSPVRPSVTVTSAFERGPDSEPLSPQLMVHCPDQREVSLIDLDIEDTTLLVVQSENRDKKGFWYLSGNDLTLHIVPSLTLGTGYSYSFQDINPDGQWLAFYVAQENSEKTTLWITSTTDPEQWEVTSVNRNTYAFWASDEQIVINGYPNNRSIESPTPLELLNPFSMEATPISPLPLNARTLISYKPVGDSAYSIYFADGQIYLYNHKTRSAYPIFHWLESRKDLLSDPHKLYTDLRIRINRVGNFDLLVKRDYGLDVALDVDFTMARQAINYDELMQPIALPGGGYDTNLLKFLPGKDFIVFERFEPPLTRDQTRRLYSLDIRNFVLHDYCLERTNATTPIASPDQRFLAWTVHESPSVDKALEVVILEASTGRLVGLPDLKLIGWGKTAK
jgi:hypothetical protein